MHVHRYALPCIKIRKYTRVRSYFWGLLPREPAWAWRRRNSFLASRLRLGALLDISLRSIHLSLHCLSEHAFFTQITR